MNMPTVAGKPTTLMSALLVVGLAPIAGTAFANGNGNFCSQTARLAFLACKAESRDDYLIAIANCTNVSDPAERQDCETEARAERHEGRGLCADQRDARLEVCDQVGEQRYDPDFDPADFVHPNEIGATVAPNRYFPLVPGRQWVYESHFLDEDGEPVTETITDTVTEEIKLIEGVTCRVVLDVVEIDGVAIEITDDWYAQDLAGNVWYCGEVARNFETFEGDDPEAPELVDIGGTWKAGRDHARPGIFMFADPPVGVVYREEISLGEAEDVAEVVSVTGEESVPAAACNGACLVTRNFTPIEPGAEETKYYALDVGLILEVDGEGNRVELIELTGP